MANVDSRGGLKPLRYANGAPYNGAATRYSIASTYATALFIGDPVDLTGTTGADGMTQQIQKATLAATNSTIGPIIAFEADPTTSLERVYSPASTAGYCWVADDPNLIFEAQCDSGTTVAVADFGGNAILIETHAGSTDTGLSGIEVDESTIAGTNDGTEMLQVLKLVNRPDNELAEHAKVEVRISLHRYRDTTSGITGA